MMNTRSIKHKIFNLIFSGFPVNSVRIFGLKLVGSIVGEKVYLGSSFLIITDKSEKDSRVIIGDRVSIAPRVTAILVSGSNNSKLKSVIPWKRGSVVIKDDAWIGVGTIIYPNIVIGEGAIVTAGSVVTKDVEPFTMVGGVPAKIIKKIEINSL